MISFDFNLFFHLGLRNVYSYDGNEIAFHSGFHKVYLLGLLPNIHHVLMHEPVYALVLGSGAFYQP